MRASVPLVSTTIQTLPAPVAIDPSVLPIEVLKVAVIALDAVSMREIVWSPQFGTHTLPKPTVRPEHGRLPAPSAIVAATVLVFGSKRETWSLGLFETQAAWSMASQSGLPPTSNTASGFNRSIGILMPGVETPGRFGGGPPWPSTTVPASAATSTRSAALSTMTVHNSRS